MKALRFFICIALFLATAALAYGSAQSVASEERVETGKQLWCETYSDDFGGHGCRIGARVSASTRDTQAQLRFVNYSFKEWVGGMYDLFIGSQFLKDGRVGAVLGGTLDPSVFLLGTHISAGIGLPQDARPEVQLELGVHLAFVLEFGLRGVIREEGGLALGYVALSL